jgi:hypothetical protein
MKHRREDIIRNVNCNNPSLIPLGKYDIEIKQFVDFEIPNKGEYGKKGSGKWSIITKLTNGSKEDMILVDLVTLKKVLSKLRLYPKMHKNDVFSMCQLMLRDNSVRIMGDIVKVKRKK